MADYKKVLKDEFGARCEHGHYFALNRETMAQHQEFDGVVPFSARSSSRTIRCPKCFSTNFIIIYNYKWLYRRRCKKCGKMFETYNTSQLYECDTCKDENRRAWVGFGGKKLTIGDKK